MASNGEGSRPMALDEYRRYGRQMIMPEWGLPGQLRLKAAKIAVIGAGGLGCPVLQYLAGAGIGTIGVFDHDTVDVSNLHRQVLHTTDRVGMNKAESAAIAMIALNPHINVIAHTEAITPENAMDLLQSFAILVDCTDRPMTRYLVNDAAVLLDIPLVSGAAISSAGQWGVYGGRLESNERDGPVAESSLDGVRRRACYRCMWPAVVGDGGGKCQDVGVWGVVTGMVGTSMASEVIKLIIGTQDSEPMLHFLHLGGNPLIRSMKLRPPSLKCISCGPKRTITDLKSYDYVTFCSLDTPIPNSHGLERIEPQELAKVLQSRKDVNLIDTRPAVEYAICAIPGSQNVPLDRILKDTGLISPSRDAIFICRQGNDSLLAAEAVQAAHQDQITAKEMTVKDVRGGLIGWSREVDPEFPLY